MADLNDVWNWPNNGANGYATDSNDWKSDNSAGISQRVNNVLTYVYKQHQTNNLHYTNDLSRTRDQLNVGFAAYKNYFASNSDDKHPTFNMLSRYPLMEFNIQPNGRKIGGIHHELNANLMPRIRVQFTDAHEFGNGEQIEFFGFDPDSTGRDDKGFNTIQPYVEVIDGFNVVLYNDSGLTQLTQITDNGFIMQNDIFFTMLDDGTGSQDAVVHFDGHQETMNTGDVLQVADTFNNLTGTVAASSGTLFYLEKISGSNSYFLYTDSGRTTHATITSGQGKDKFASPASGGIPFSIASSGSAAAIAVDISDSSFNSLRSNIESQNMTPNTNTEDETNIFRGFCRVQLTAGTGTSKTIPSSMDDTAFFGYKYTKSTGNLEILTDPTGTFVSRDSNVLTATNGSGNITGNIKIIDFWTYRNESPGTFGTGLTKQTAIIPASGTNVGGIFWHGATADTSLTPVSPLTHPLASEASTLYSGTKSTNDDNSNFDKLIYQFAGNNCRSPGRRSYFFQNSSNVATAGAQYDFTKFWRPGEGVLSPTYITTPTATPNVNSSGFLTGTSDLDGFPKRGLFTLAGLGLTNTKTTTAVDILSGSPAKPATHVIEKVGIFVINPKADEYVAPTAYAPDVFDTDDEWDTDELNDAKDWPTVVAPNGVKFTQVIPSSVTKSQNGTKYVRDAGFIRHQLEVSYPPMTEENFRQYEAVAQAARGQAVPFFFEIGNTGDLPSTGLFWNRTDSDNANLNLDSSGTLRIVTPVAVGDKVLTVEGFEASKTKAFIRGECIIVPSAISKNGHIAHVINDNVTTNKFGEAKIRLAMGSPTVLKGSATSGNASQDRSSVFKNPFHLVVTLAEDSFEYERGTDNLYRFTCRFELDNFK